MSIQVNDFQWEPGKNDAEYIKLLESSRDEWQKIAQKAIAKLKALSTAQEPRVMTVGDLYGEDMGFYERKHEECVWPVLIARGGPDDDGTVGIIRKDAFEIKADCGLINQTWRIWTAYPTDEQRRNELWKL